jgi:NAD(P)-dependent dehydrogenase (short-subunit alcohol dehydrogenase family)
VNNAAIAGALGPIAEIPLDEYEYACGVIQRSVFLGMREAARAMQPRRSGAIVKHRERRGPRRRPRPHVYSACKAAVIALTESVALELAESGIRVNAVLPRRDRDADPHRRHRRALGRAHGEDPPGPDGLPGDGPAWACPRKSPRRCSGWRATRRATSPGTRSTVDGGLMAADALAQAARSSCASTHKAKKL